MDPVFIAYKTPATDAPRTKEWSRRLVSFLNKSSASFRIELYHKPCPRAFTNFHPLRLQSRICKALEYGTSL